VVPPIWFVRAVTRVTIAKRAAEPGAFRALSLRAQALPLTRPGPESVERAFLDLEPSLKKEECRLSQLVEGDSGRIVGCQSRGFEDELFGAIDDTDAGKSLTGHLSLAPRTYRALYPIGIVV
jgi:hypothetical protein